MFKLDTKLHYSDVFKSTFKKLKTNIKLPTRALAVGGQYLNFISNNHKGDITYLSGQRLNKVAERINKRYKNDIQTVDYFGSNFREGFEYTTRPGKVFKKLFPKLTDSALQVVIQRWTAVFNTEKVFEIWSSNQIKKAYHEKNYLSKLGTLGNSCMRYEKNQQSMEFYEKNKASIVVLLESGKIAGRAILWGGMNCVTKEGKILKHPFMDRIYLINDNNFELFYNFAVANAYVYKKDGGIYYNKIFQPNMYLFQGNIYLDGITELPYCDTIINLFYKNHIITNFNRVFSNKIMKTKPYLNVFKGKIDYNSCLCLQSTNPYRRELDKNCIQELFTNNYFNIKDVLKVKRGYIAKINIVNIPGYKEKQSKRDPRVIETLSYVAARYHFKKDCYFSRDREWYIPKDHVIEVKKVILVAGDSTVYKVVSYPVKDYIYDTPRCIKECGIIKLRCGEFVRSDSIGVKSVGVGKNRIYVLEDRVRKKTKMEINQQYFVLNEMKLSQKGETDWYPSNSKTYVFEDEL